MKRCALRRLGKKGHAWEAVRRELKAELFALGITTCELRREGCMGSFALGFAHSKKRRNIIGDEIREACLACPVCHEQIEAMPEDVMGGIVRAVIAARSE